MECTKNIFLTYKFEKVSVTQVEAWIYFTLPSAVQADEAVSQASHKILVVVARPEHQVAVDSQDPQGVQQGHLLCHRLVGPTELVEHRPVQTVVDGVEGKTLGTPLRLDGERVRKKKSKKEGEREDLRKEDLE